MEEFFWILPIVAICAALWMEGETTAFSITLNIRQGCATDLRKEFVHPNKENGSTEPKVLQLSHNILSIYLSIVAAQAHPLEGKKRT